MRGAIRKLIQPVLWKAYRWYLSKKRWYRYDGLQVCIYPSVFHPGMLLSTKILLDFMKDKDVKGKSVLELGAGSGLIALWLNRAGAKVWASDINPAALRSIRESCERNDLSVETLHSDLFDNINEQAFDYILINPPFYPKQPKNNRELAFFCGENFQYFKKLFEQLRPFLHPENQTFMILSDDCNIEAIEALAAEKKLELSLEKQLEKLGEVHFVFRILC